MDLEKFYKRINKKTIEDFIKNKQEEHLSLEFKTVSKADLSDKNDRKNLAKSIAGFANSGGGVIIWGVDARKNQDGIDCACGKKEIQPLPQLVSRLNDLTGELVKPIVEGVKHKRIPPKAEKGFAVTLVPESDAGPHMAMGFEGRHYKRSGDSFYPMEHFDIEDMFGRRKKPKLSLYFDIKRGFTVKGPNTTFECQLFVGIENKGRGIAKNAALAIEVNEPYHLKKLSQYTSERHDFLQVSRPGSKKKIFYLGADAVIHSNSSVIVTIIAFNVTVAQRAIKDVVIDFEIMAEDIQTKEERAVISGDEIREKIVPNFANA